MPSDIARARLRTPRPFDLELAVRGHGWYDLAPNAWDPDARAFTTAFLIGNRAVEARVGATASGLSLRMSCDKRLSIADRAAGRAAIARMLRLDEDLGPFWTACARVPRLAWVATRGAGRIQRSAALFEDLMKLLFTTNCSWAATRHMVRRTVEALGTPTPSGRRAFPDAATCAAQGEAFWRNEIRVGYRAASCHAITNAFATGEVRDAHFEDEDASTDEVRARLLALPGFGPYAAGQALRLLGRHEDLALDSWCRAKIAQLQRRKAPPPDATIERRYARFGRHKGLALWMDLTADWHLLTEG